MKQLAGRCCCLVLAAILLVCTVLPAAAAEAHTFELRFTEPAGCESEGANVFVCTDCGATKTKIIPPLGHDFAPVWTVDREPTCDKEGLKSRHCTRCSATTDLLVIQTTRHDYEVQVVAPTCTDLGYTLSVCRICGTQRKDQYTDALGHDPGPWVVDREPTCEQAGLRHRDCKRCGEQLDQLPIAATDHVYTDTVVPPTCTEAGYTLHVCRLCGKSYQDKPTKATGHRFASPGQRVSEPTCTQKGSEVVTCAVCGFRQTQSVAALGHDYSTAWTIDKAATCAAKGEQSHHCTRCGARKDVTAIDRLPHTVVVDAAVAPTCTEAGKTAGSHCSVCNAVLEKQVKLPAAGHSFSAETVVTAATCTRTGKATSRCTVCGVVQTKSLPALGHDYSTAWTVDKAATCTAKGEKSHHCTRCDARKDVTELPRTDHTPVQDVVVAPTCTTPGKSAGTHCAVCGKVLENTAVIPKLGHDFAVVSTQTQATCTTEGRATFRCTRCGVTETRTVPALGHDYSTTWTIDKAATCTAKGEQSHHCTRCGARKDVTELPRTDHTPVQDIVVAPTCTENGKSAGTHCAVCGKTLENTEVVPKLGHDFATVRVKVKATCTATGSAVVRCTRCNLTEVQTTPALGHKYKTKWTIDKPATCTAKGEKSHHCTRCEKRKDVTELPRKDHTVVKDRGVAATCTQSGRTAGKHCSVCGTVIKAQTVIPATGHKKKTKLTPATFDKAGKSVTVCAVCGETLDAEKIPAIRSVKLSAKSFVYDGAKKQPKVSVKAAGGKTLKNKTDFQVNYAGGRKRIGVYAVKVTFCGKYTGKKTLKFKIVPQQPTGLSAAEGETTIALRWDKVPGATGYFIYKLNSKKAPVRIAAAKTAYYKIKNLKPGTKYTFLVRAYTKVKNDVFWSADSAHKSVATRPKTPQLKLARSNRAVVLRWNNCGSGCTYEIYYSADGNGPFTCIGTTTKTSFTTQQFAKGRTVHFKIKAIAPDGGASAPTATSAVKAITV